MLFQKRAPRMAENRRTNQRRVLKSGTIEFDRGAFSCTIRNLSEGGAALDVPYALAISQEFKLIMLPIKFAGSAASCGAERTGLASCLSK